MKEVKVRGVIFEPDVKGAKWTLVLVATKEEQRKIRLDGGVDSVVMKITPGTAEPWSLDYYKKAELRIKGRLFIALRGYRSEIELICKTIPKKTGFQFRIINAAFFRSFSLQKALATILELRV